LRISSRHSLPNLLLALHTVYPAYGDLQSKEVVTLPPLNAPIRAMIAE
jgi:hypothetical protein